MLFGLAIALMVDVFAINQGLRLGLLVSTDWDPVNDQYGALPFIYGTLVSSALALMIAVPLSLGVALCLSEMAPTWLSHRLGFLVELLAAIPQRGLRAVGDFRAGPMAARPRRAAARRSTWAFCRFSRDRDVSVSMLCGGRDSRDHGHAVHLVGLHRRFSRRAADAARGGARARRDQVGDGADGGDCRTAISGVIGAIILGLGRALGETIAVAMVIGNSPEISASLFTPSATLASVIANEFAEATSDAVPVGAGRAGPGAAGARARAQRRGARAGAGRHAAPVRGRADDGQTCASQTRRTIGIASSRAT